ncbi:MAG: PKD domain-containing protein, partial [Deltaproteobacteria bacterium]|nr:PKD domain-containing protein [Deltaproteobacteria bacterium]
FYASPTAGKAPHTVIFHNLSEGGIVAYQWDFGDGSEPGSEANPSHIYSDTGIYSVRLTVTAEDGTTDYLVKEEYITVADLADCPFEAILNNRVSIADLHELRDRRLNGFWGKMVTTIFYKNAARITAVLRDDPELQRRFRELVVDNIDVSREVINTGQATLSESNAAEIIDFLENLKKQGGFRLGFYTDLVIKGIEYRFMLNGIGIDVQ